MILSVEEQKHRMLKFKKRHMASNLYASLESFEHLANLGEEPEIWQELRDYTKSLIHELIIESQTKGFQLL